MFDGSGNRSVYGYHSAEPAGVELEQLAGQLWECGGVDGVFLWGGRSAVGRLLGEVGVKFEYPFCNRA